MSDALAVVAVGRERWLELCRGFADHNYRQSWDFGVHAAERVGARSEHVAIEDGGRAVALADVRIRKLPVVGGGIAYVTGGPLTRADAGFDASRHLAAVDALRREFAERRGLVLRLTAPIGPAAWNAEVADGLARAGFETTDAARRYRTMVVDIARPLPEVRKKLRQKWRNCLNRAEREAAVTLTTSFDAAAFDRFAALFDEFVVRKGFDVEMGVDFYGRVQRDADEGARFAVILAEREDRLVGGYVGSVLGDTCVYLLGATAPEALKMNAAYLLQWRAIELAKERGCRWYDLGGIDPDANPGVFHFKEGMGGDDVTAAGPLQWCSGTRARLALALEARYRAMRAPRPEPASDEASEKPVD